MNYKEVCSERHNQLCSGINLVCVDQSLLDNHFISSRYEYVLFSTLICFNFTWFKHNTIWKRRIREELQKNQMAETSISEPEIVAKPELIYRCKKCRRIVASEENMISHERGKGESSFKWNKRSSGSWENKNQPDDCTSIFVEPMKWMQAGTWKFPSYPIISIRSPICLIFFYYYKKMTKIWIEKKIICSKKFMWCRNPFLIEFKDYAYASNYISPWCCIIY